MNCERRFWGFLVWAVPSRHSNQILLLIFCCIILPLFILGCIGPGNPILPNPDRTCGSSHAGLALFFFVPDLLEIDLILFFWIGFWLLWIKFGKLFSQKNVHNYISDKIELQYLNVCVLSFFYKDKNDIKHIIIEYISIIALKYRLLFFHFGFRFDENYFVGFWSTNIFFFEFR